MDLIQTAETLRERLERANQVAFVPTMGNLHEGHLSLMRIGKRHADCVVASIFVDGAFRPGFFNGVCTVVLKLFNLVQPDYAVFGKKDRQQLKLVRGMVQQFNLPIQIVPGETVRSDDGLALSSRNNYLSPIERTEAPRLYRTLREIADAIAGGRTDYANLEAAGRADLARHGWKVDYIAVRNGIGLRIPHPEGFDHPNLLIVLGAATLGATRLIDNVDVIRKDGED